jgi:deoxyribose-phosphate aldolase
MVRDAVLILKGSEVKVGTVIGFPHGSNVIQSKIEEAFSAYHYGAEEVDMVINIGKAVQGDWEYVSKEIRNVFRAVPRTMILKVIFETDLVSQEKDIVQLCQICNEIGVGFAKTSTGFVEGGIGAKISDIKLMRKVLDSKIGLKASGGIKTLDEALAFIRLGCTRIGTSKTEIIMEEALDRYGI